MPTDQVKVLAQVALDLERARKERIGPTYFRGQAWVELKGWFNASELREIADKVESQCKGMEKEKTDDASL